jgi:hypothetical protein
MRAQISELPLRKRKTSRSLELSVLALCALSPLAACTGMNRPPAVAPPPVRASDTHAPQQQRSSAIKPKKAPPRDVAAHEARAAEPDNTVRIASIDPKSLMGLDPDTVQKRLGAPARMENSALSREWIYAAPGCSFRIFFYPNVNSTSFRALKYGSTKENGDALDSSDACVRRILTARNNDDN